MRCLIVLLSVISASSFLAQPAALQKPNSVRRAHLPPQPAPRVAQQFPLHRVTARSRPVRLALGASGLMAAVMSAPATLVLAVTIAFEVLATTCMKLAATRPAYYAGVFLGYGLCFTLFPIALRKLPLSMAYATWSGVGTAAATVIGAALFSEKLTLLKFVSIGLIIAGVMGLNL